MQTSIRSPHLKVTDPIREYIEKKVGRLARQASHYREAQVSIGQKGGLVSVKIMLHPGPLVAETDDRDLYRAIDLAVDRMRNAVEHHKAKHR